MITTNITNFDSSQLSIDGQIGYDEKDTETVSIMEVDSKISSALGDDEKNIQTASSGEVESSLSSANSFFKMLEKVNLERKLLRGYLEQIISPDIDLNHTLLQYLLHLCYTYANNKKENHQETSNALYMMIAILEGPEHNPKEFNKYSTIVLQNADNSRKLLIQLIAQIGRIWFDQPLYSILSREIPLESPNSKVLREMLLNSEKLYSVSNLINVHLDSVYKQIIDNDKAKIEYEIILKKLKLPRSEKNSKIHLIRSQHKKNIANTISNKKLVDEAVKFSFEKLVGQIKNSSQIINDYLFLKLKWAHEVYFKFFKNQFDLLEKVSVQGLDECRIIFEMGNSILRHPTAKRGVEKKQDPYWEIHKNNLILQTALSADRDTPGELDGCLEEENELFKNLCNQYESITGHKSDAEIHRSMTWLMFGDEVDEKKISMVKEKSKSVKSVEQTLPVKSNNLASSLKNQQSSKKTPSSFVETNENPLQPHEKILTKHSGLIHDLSKIIKIALDTRCKEAQLIDSNHQRAKIYSKELRDHLHYASLNFDLFCKAILNQDLYAIQAIIPFLFLDQHLAIEQMLKHQIMVKGKVPLNSHHLFELYAYSSCKAQPDLEPFIKEFSDAMLQARFPISWNYKIQNEPHSESLNWLLFSQKLCQIINPDEKNEINLTELTGLCTYVFDSYQKTLQCLLGQIELEKDVYISVSEMLSSFAELKVILETSIKNNQKNLKVKTLEIKNMRTNPKLENPILINRQKLMDVGQDILNKTKIDSTFPRLILEEASDHLLKIDAIDYLQKNYEGMQYAALHHRNLLMFQWVYELLYRFHGHIAGLGELRWVCNHNLEEFHAFAFPKEEIPQTLSEFNIGRNLHYSHEISSPQLLTMIQELLKARKDLKNLDPTDPEWILVKDQKDHSFDLDKSKNRMKSCREEILEKGIALLETLIKMIQIELN